MSIEIRRTSAADWREVRRIRLQALAEAPWAFGSTLEREQGFSEETWRQRAGAKSAYLAWDGDRVVGTVTGLADPEPAQGTVQLVAMYVDPGARGTGCAHRLIDAVVAAAVAGGATRVLLDVTDVNPAAGRCYRRYGFAPTGRRKPSPHTPHITELEMVLELEARYAH
jgi:ribosomal protein S18 acetylase RimI-like enzyme